MTIEEGIALLLEAEGIGAYDPDGVTGDIFIDDLPDSPDDAIQILGGPGLDSDPKFGYGTVSFQIIVRGQEDPRPPKVRARLIYSLLTALGPSTLPDGTRVILVLATQSDPFPMGKDGNERHRYSLNFQAEIRQPTTNRQ